MSAPDSRRLVDRDVGALSIRRQCELLGIPRFGFYRPPAPANDNDLPLMRRIDELVTPGRFLAPNHPALERRAGDHAMTDVTTSSDLLQSTADVCSQLFDDWFDPIETI